MRDVDAFRDNAARDFVAPVRTAPPDAARDINVAARDVAGVPVRDAPNADVRAMVARPVVAARMVLLPAVRDVSPVVVRGDVARVRTVAPARTLPVADVAGVRDTTSDADVRDVTGDAAERDVPDASRTAAFAAAMPKIDAVIKMNILLTSFPISEMIANFRISLQ